MNQKINEIPKNKSTTSRLLLDNRGIAEYPCALISLIPRKQVQENLSFLPQLRLDNPKNNSISKGFNIYPKYKESLAYSFFVHSVSNMPDIYNSQFFIYHT